MAAIEELLRECGERVEYASPVDAAGYDVRVAPEQAYRQAVCPAALASPHDVVYLVECDVPTRGGASRVVIDHHRPGDPGYGRPPSEFMRASSIGQVIDELCQLVRLPRHWRRLHCSYYCASFAFDRDAGWVVIRDTHDTHVVLVPRHLVLAAAADHCLAAAYRGECLGVVPDELMAWRAQSRAAHQGRAVASLLVDVEAAREAIFRSPALDIDTRTVVRDMRSCPVCDGHGGAIGGDGATEPCHAGPRGPIPELPEAACRDGVAYVAGPFVGPDGRRKYTCSGPAHVIRVFLGGWAAKQGLIDLYGDPERGFAGGYETVPEQAELDAAIERRAEREDAMLGA